MQTTRFPQIPISSGSAERAEELARVGSELFDDHADTSRLPEDPSTHLILQTHRHYLRDVQRAGREILARGAAEEVREVRLP